MAETGRVKTTLRITPAMRERLEIRARELGISVNALIAIELDRLDRLDSAPISPGDGAHTGTRRMA